MGDIYRFIISNLQGGINHSNVAIAELELHATIGGADLTSLESNTTAAHHSIGSNEQSQYAIDDNLDTMWNGESNATLLSANGVWWEITFTSYIGNVLEYVITSRVDYLDDCPIVWEFCKWNGSFWDILSTETTTSDWTNNEARTFTIPLPVVETPVITPITGDYFPDQLISITCGTSGADIYYTLDGSDPDETDNLYLVPFDLVEAKTIKAIGIKTDYTDSFIVTNIFTISVPIVTGWKACKDQGPFDFTEQPNKWGYLNNPRWTEESEPGHEHNYTGREDEEPQIWNITQNPSSEENTSHIPCGHWHKKLNIIYPTVNIYGLFDGTNYNNDTIAGVLFYKGKLTYIGDYISPGDHLATNSGLGGLTFFQGDLVTVARADADAVFRRISADPISGKLPLIKQYDIFNSYDVQTLSTSSFIKNTAEDKLYYLQNDTGQIITIGDTFNKESRSFAGTVITGTDGNLYYNQGVNSWDHMPISSVNWPYYWRLITDNLTDGAITTWDTGNNIPADASTGEYYQGNLYNAAGGCLRKINLTSYEIENSVYYSLTTNMTIYKNNMHVVRTILTSMTLEGFSLDTLTTTITRTNFSGRYGVLAGMQDILVMSTRTYVSDLGTLYKLNRSDYSIIDSITIQDLLGFEDAFFYITPIDDTYLLCARTGGITVVNITTLTLVDDIDLDAVDGSYYRKGALGLTHRLG